MKIKVYKDRAGEWRWHLVSNNGRIVAESGEGYKSKLYAMDAADRFINDDEDVEVEQEDEEE